MLEGATGVARWSREAIRTGERTVSKSQRQLAEDAGTRQPTVSKSVRRLEEQGLLQRLSSGREQTTVRLTADWTRKSDSTYKPAPAGSSVESLFRVGPAHPVFSAGGLRGGHRLTYEVLSLYRRPHAGLDHLSGLRALWDGLPMDGEVRLRWDFVPAAEVPRDEEAFLDWLYAEWERMDAWVAASEGVRSAA